jgi:hypothetical protein
VGKYPRQPYDRFDPQSAKIQGESFGEEQDLPVLEIGSAIACRQDGACIAVMVSEWRE